jgi:two-component system sensor histidine kinase YesM
MQDSIKNRLLKRFVLMVVLPVLAVFMLMTLIYWLTMSHTITEQANSVLDEAGNAITGQFEQYEALLTFLEKDQDLLYAGEIASGANISADKKADLTLLLTGYADSIASVDRLSVQYRNGLFLSTDLLEPPPAASQLTAWYQDPLARPGQTICLSYRAGENPVLTDTPHYASSLAVCRTICDSLGHPVAVANLTIRGETLGDFLSAAYSQQGGQTYLVTAEGALVNSPLRFDELAGFDRRRYLETRRDLPGLPLTLVNFLPLRPFLSQQYLTLTLGILSGLVAMLFFVVHTRCTVREFVRPIEDLRELMRQAQLGNLDVAYHPDTRDEFADLADSFNQMVAEIKRLIA